MVEDGDAFSLPDVCSQYVGGKWDIVRWSMRVIGRLNEGHESQHPCSMELALRRSESKSTYDFG